MKNKERIIMFLAVVASAIPWMVYLQSCRGSEIFCFSDYKYIFATFHDFALALFIPVFLSFFASTGIFYKWLRGLIVLVFILILYISISPESTNIGDPTPEKGAAILISAVIIFLWSTIYLSYQIIREKKLWRNS